MAAPKSNLYALGNNGGRPRKYETPEDMEFKIMEYFDACVQNKTEVAVNGLVLHLGFRHKSSLYEYEAREEFTDIIKRARTAIEYSYELDLRTFKFGGAIFALKNIDRDFWKEKVEQEVKQTITNVTAAFGSTIQPTQEPEADS